MGDRYFDLANFAVNNELDEAGEAALLEDYFAERAEPAAARDAAADEVHVRLPRGDVGRGAGASSRSSTSTSPATPTSTSTGCSRPPPTRASPAGSRRRVSPRAELPESARCVIVGGGRRRGLDRLPPRQARLARRRPARARGAHLRLDLPLRRARRPAARLGLADEDDDALGRASTGGLATESEFDPGWVECGGIRLASSEERHGGAAPPGGLGEDLRPAARADLGRRGEGDVPADVDRRGARRAPGCPPTATSIPSQLTYALADGARREGGLPVFTEHPGDRDRGRRRPGARGRDRAGPDRGRGRRQRRAGCTPPRSGGMAGVRVPGDPDVATSTWSPSRSARRGRRAGCPRCATPTCSSTSARTAAAW